MCQLEQLDRNRDPGDLASEPRDRLAEEQAPERRRLAERAEVERCAADKAARARRRLADGLGLRELDVRRTLQR
jgi:hypothetical protein